MPRLLTLCRRPVAAGVVEDDVVDPVVLGLDVEVAEPEGTLADGVDEEVACTEDVTVLGATLRVAAPSGPVPTCRAAGSMWAL